jgi:hypothetical protein
MIAHFAQQMCRFKGHMINTRWTMRYLLRRFGCLHLFLYPVRLHLISSVWGEHKGQQLAILYHIGFVERTAPI